MKLILKITKYCFIIALILFVSFFFIFYFYNKKLNYSIPNIIHVEIYDKNENHYLDLNNTSRRNYVKIDNIDKDIIDAFISIEDKDFYKHKGINIKRIFGALLTNIKSKGIKEGASTITQQYVKNIFLSSEKKIKRKIDEAFISINIESKYSKNEILEGYLNTIYFDHGIYGIEDACRFYFDKSSSDVTIKEAAILASIPKSPINYSPIKNYEKNLERTKIVLNEMKKDEIISLNEYNEAINEQTIFYGKLDSTSDYNAPYFQDIVINKLKELNISTDILKKGIKVYTSLDLGLNKIINDSIKKYFPTNSELELAVVAIDSKTGEVLSLIGGKDYQKSVFNRTLSLRQPGSTIKPFLYYTALKEGFTVTTTFNSSKTDFFINNEIYSPKNFGDTYPNKDVTMIYALATSDNIYAVKTHLFLGIDKLKKTLENFGFSNTIKENPSLALGTSEVSLLELTTAYAKIASMGKDINPLFITKITDINDNIIYNNTDEFTIKYDSDICYILSDAMTNAFDNRVAINTSVTLASIANKINSKYAAKSGSTDYDNWILGFNPNITLGIWTGYDNPQVVKNSETRFIKNIWADIIYTYNNRDWYETPNNVIGIPLNPTTGMIAKENQYKKTLYFQKNNLPFYIYLKRMETIIRP